MLHRKRRAKVRLGAMLAGSWCFLFCGGLAVAAPDSRDALARADSLQDVLELLISRWDYIQAHSVAEEQLRLHAGILGVRHPRSLGSLQAIGRIAHLSGEQDLSEEILGMVLDLRREVLGPSHPEVAETLYWRGLVARYAGDRELSWRCYEDALRILEPRRGDHRPLIAAIKQAQGSWLRGQDLDTAIGLYREALALRQESRPFPDFETADNLTWLAWTLSRAGRHDEALEPMRRAQEHLESLGMPEHALMGTILNLQADALVIRGEWEEAEQLFRRIAAIFEASRDAHFTGFARRKSPLDGYNGWALCLLNQGRSEEAWLPLQASKGSLGLDFLALARWKQVEPNTYPEIRKLRGEYLEIEQRWQRVPRSSAVELDADDWTLLLKRFELRARMYELEQRFLRRHRPQPASLEVLQRNLAPDAAYIGWVAAQLGTDLRQQGGPFYATHWVYVVRSSGPVRWIPLWETTSPRAYMDRRRPWTHYMDLTTRATNWKLRMEPDEDLRASARELCKWFFEPAQPDLEGVNTLIVEWSAGLPLESLVGADGDYLDAHYAMAYVPSAAALVLLNRTSKRSGLQSILALGDPIFDPGQPAEVARRPVAGEGGSSQYPESRLEVTELREALSRAPAALARLPRLPLSGFEVEQLAGMFEHATLLQGTEATESTLGSLARSGALADFDIIHIATHALIDDHPERCALALSRTNLAEHPMNDGLVDAEEILFSWELDAEILTLSGCQTARSSGYTRGEFVGFTQALLGVGARSVLASIWKADDMATALLMERFYENLTGGYDDVRMGQRGLAMSKALALREAKIWLRNHRTDDGLLPFAHPIYWSGFILTGSPH